MPWVAGARDHGASRKGVERLRLRFRRLDARSAGAAALARRRVACNGRMTITTAADLWVRLRGLAFGAPRPLLLYCADPMCSWCWGFSPVLAQLAVRYHERLTVVPLVGGLRAGNTVPTDTRMREEILQHWRAVQASSGQPFAFEGALPDGFVYDTEPACRAVVTVHDLAPVESLRFFQRLQHAFYVEQQPITRSEVLASLAASAGVDPATFSTHFGSAAMHMRTRGHFLLTHELGVRGFPTVWMVDAQRLRLLTHGYRPLEQLTPVVDAWLGG